MKGGDKVKTYLVTGGAGFIGSNFILYILKKYNDIRVINLDKLTYAANLDNLKGVANDSRYQLIKGDICDLKLIKDIFRNNDINYVVHFAAESHVDRSITNPDLFVKNNILGTVNLLNGAKEDWDIGKSKWKENVKYLQVSTDEVYGSLGDIGYFSEDTPLDPHSPYSASKASADIMVKAYYDTYKMPINITRCSNNYGPFQFEEKLIPLLINKAIKHEKLPIYGDGLNIRDWLYVEDHVKAIDMVINNGVVGQIYNVGGHNEHTNINIAKTIIEYLNKNVDSSITNELIAYVDDRKGHDRRYGINPEKIKSQLGWYPETDFNTGIIKTIKWYIENM